MTYRLTCASSLLLGALLGSAAFAQDDKAVTIVLSEELELIDPCMASQSNIGRVLLQNISETLTVFEPSTAKLLPKLAESWEETEAGAWRFKLRSGVNFSDGTAFGAADVVHSLERAISDQISCEIGGKYFGGFEIQAVAVDDTTVDITSDPAQPILPLLMSSLTIVPEETPLEYVQTPVGTGPYEMTERNMGTNIVLEKRDDYWGEAPEVAKATYIFRSDSSVRAAMVEVGEADIAPVISELDATNQDTDFAYPNSETTYMRLDHATAPTDDRRVREALNLAVDREAFIGTLMAQEAVLATAVVPPSTAGYNPDLKPYAFDPDRARELLAEAKADGVPVDDEIRIIGRIGLFPNDAEVLEALMAMFKDVGFNVTLEMLEVGEYNTYYNRPFAEDRGPQMVSAQHDNAKGDPVFSMYFKYGSEGQQSGLVYPELDEMIAKATAATGDERAALWSEVMTSIHEEHIGDVLLFHMVGFSRVSPRLDFKPTIATNSELQLSQIGFK
ncbi:MAG: ABC transporter substrate-binding protein [Cereibacter changlensis]